MGRMFLRAFRLQPLYAFACAGTIAIAVAASATSFTIVKRALLDPLPFVEDERLVAINTLREDGTVGAMSVFVLEDLRSVETSPRRSPSAMRTSISAVRCATAYAITR